MEAEHDELDTQTGPARYGKYYWYILLANGDELYMNADEMRTVCGCLELTRTKKDGAKQLLFAVGEGEWKLAYAASCLDGDPVNVEHWNKGKNAGGKGKKERS